MRKDRTPKLCYGVTTVPERFEISLPMTLESLAKSGFDNPTLFIDGAAQYLPQMYREVMRDPPIRAYGNWVLAMWELYMRDPGGRCRYIIFQDDILAVHGLRQYLEKLDYQKGCYYNLCTYPKNAELLNGKGDGWHESNQKGLGAQALMFDRKAVIALLSTRRFCARPQEATRWWQNIDGVVSDCMKDAGWKELVHLPSLVTHVVEGQGSTLRRHQQPEITVFPGEDFDATGLS